MLVANDSLKHPASGMKVHGTSQPLEKFDDELLSEARLAIAIEAPEDGAAERKEAFEAAWEEIHDSNKLPGLESYEDDDEIDQHQLMTEAFEVRNTTPPTLISTLSQNIPYLN